MQTKKATFLPRPKQQEMTRETQKNKSIKMRNAKYLPQEKQSKPKARAFPANETFFCFLPPLKSADAAHLFFPPCPSSKNREGENLHKQSPFPRSNTAPCAQLLGCTHSIAKFRTASRNTWAPSGTNTPRLQCVGACLSKLTKVQPICRAGFRQPPLPSSP